MEIRSFLDDTNKGLVDFESHPSLPIFATDVLKSQAVDGHYVCVVDGQIVARLSLWWRSVPHLEDGVLGVVGHYDSINEDCGEALLSKACEILKNQGVTLVVGPMDGNTWRRYRLVTEWGEEAPFFMEPINPPEYPKHFLAAGFSAYAQYQSALNENLAYQDERVLRAQDRLAVNGVMIRSIQLEKFTDELIAMHRLSLISFRKNILYTDLSEEAFVRQYLPFKDKINPEFVFLAEYEGELVGYLFACPDFYRIQASGLNDTLILKTAAVLPGKRYAGLGSVLADQLHQIGHRLGYTRVIHALAAKSNAVTNITARYGKTMREYTLYSKSV